MTSGEATPSFPPPLDWKPAGFQWPTGNWPSEFLRQIVDAMHAYNQCVKLSPIGGGDGFWAPDSYMWNIVEEVHAKFLEKNGGKLDPAVKLFTKEKGLRELYMKTYPAWDPVQLNGYLDEIHINENDPHASALHQMVENFRGNDLPRKMKPDRFRYLAIEKFEKTDASKAGVPHTHVAVLSLKKAPWSLAQYKCLGEHPEWEKERRVVSQANAIQPANLSANSIYFNEEIVSVMIQITTTVCDRIQEIKTDGGLLESTVTPELKKLIVDAIYISAAYNLCARPEDLTPGVALCKDLRTVAMTMDEAITVDSDGLCACIHCINKTGITTEGTKIACILPPAVALRLFGTLGDVWSIAMPLYASNKNWATETMSPHFACKYKPHRWAPLWQVLTLNDRPSNDGKIAHEAKFTGYNLKHLSVSLLKHIFVMGAGGGDEYNDNGVELLQMKQCNHSTTDATLKYKTVSFIRGAKFTADRRLFLDEHGAIRVVALSGEEITTRECSCTPDDDVSSSSGESVPGGSDTGDSYHPEAEPPAKRYKVDHNLTNRASYQAHLDALEATGYELEY